MNKYQTIANDAYGDDAIAQAIADPDMIDDTLAIYIASDLSDEEDCKNITLAIRRMEVARDDLLRVLEALVESSMDQEI